MSLYKYVVPERIDVLQNASIRFTPVAALNDPFELKPYFELFADDDFVRQVFLSNSELSDGFEIGYSMISQVLDEMEKLFPDEAYRKEIDEVRKDLPRPEILKQQAREEYPTAVEQIIGMMKDNMPLLRNEVFKEYGKSIGVLCLSEKCDNPLMWAHYTNNHKGFLIEFDEKHEFFSKKRHPAESFGGLRKVKYSDIRPNKQFLLGLTPQEIFLTKSKKWKYEQEWRMIASLENEEGRSLKKDGSPVLDADGLTIILCPLPPSCITGVIFGSRMTEENKAAISNLLSSDRRYSHVRKYQSVLDEQSFKLHTIPV